MPEFRLPIAIEQEASGEGWTVATLADGRHVPGMAMAARIWRLEAGTSGPVQTFAGASERFLYVIAGSGSLHIGDDATALAPEDMVWIEAGDTYRLEAGEGLLQVLEATSGTG